MEKILVEDKIVMKKIGEIKPYVRNPRKNDKTVELLCKVIPKVGFNVPLVIDEKGVIIKGHARFTAAIRLGMTELPCIISHADPEAIKADRIADNKISEFSEWVNDELLHEIDMIDIDFDFSELGISVPKFDDIPIPEPDFGEEKAEISQEERDELYRKFLEQQEKSAEITTQKAIDAAKVEQKEVAAPPPRYYKCVCEKCGHIMFVREGDICDRLED